MRHSDTGVALGTLTALAVALARVSVGGLLQVKYEDIGDPGPAPVDDGIGYGESLTVVAPIAGALLLVSPKGFTSTSSCVSNNFPSSFRPAGHSG